MQFTHRRRNQPAPRPECNRNLTRPHRPNRRRPRTSPLAAPPRPASPNPVERSTGIVVRLTRLGETSWIVHWCTAEHGWIKTVAKGARAPRSPFAGKLDLFFDAELVWARARRGDLHALREVALVDPRASLRRSWLATLAASYFVRLVEQAVEPDHPVPELHHLLVRALDHLCHHRATRRAVAHFEAELARLLGIGGDPARAAGALAEALGGLPSVRADLHAELDK